MRPGLILMNRSGLWPCAMPLTVLADVFPDITEISRPATQVLTG